jgi:hypothetical protein
VALGRTSSQLASDIKSAMSRYLTRTDNLSLVVTDKSGIEHR